MKNFVPDDILRVSAEPSLGHTESVREPMIIDPTLALMIPDTPGFTRLTIRGA